MKVPRCELSSVPHQVYLPSPLVNHQETARRIIGRNPSRRRQVPLPVDKPKIPTSLRVVAVLFILDGVTSSIAVLVSAMHGELNINFGLLGFFIGPGLLCLSSGWRRCALVLTWFGLIGVPLATMLMLSFNGPLHFKLFGQEVCEAPKLLGLIFAVFIFGLTLWQYRVLTREDVRQLFGA